MSKPAATLGNDSDSSDDGDSGVDTEMVIPHYNRPSTQQEAESLAEILGPRLRGEEPKKKAKKEEKKKEDEDDPEKPDETNENEKEKEKVKKQEKPKENEEEHVSDGDVISIDDITADNIEDVDIKNVVTRKGRPISAPVTQVINLQREKISKYKTENLQLTEKLKALESTQSGIKKEEYEALQKERDELKKHRDDIEFEESDAFKENFVNPMNEAAAEVDDYLKMIPKEALASLGKMVPDMEAALHSGKRELYMQIVDQITDLFKSQSSAAAFSMNAIKLWGKAEKWHKAKKEKEKIREELKKGYVANKAKTIDSLKKIIPDKVKSLVPSDIDAFIKSVSEDPKLKKEFDLDSFSSDRIAEIAASINNPSEEVLELLAAGNYHKTIGKNRDVLLRKALSGANDKLTKLEQENERLRKKLKAANGGDPSDSIIRRNGRGADDDDDDEEEEYAITSVAKRVIGRINRGELKP